MYSPDDTAIQEFSGQSTGIQAKKSGFFADRATGEPEQEEAVEKYKHAIVDAAMIFHGQHR